MTAVLHHVVIRCAACATVVLEADTYATIDETAGVTYCAGAECVALRAAAGRAS